MPLRLTLLVFLATTTAQAATLGQLIDNYPEPQCANVLPIVLDWSETKGNNYILPQLWSGDNPPQFRLAGSQGGYTQGFTGTPSQALEIRPQLQWGGNMTEGRISLFGHIDGQFVNSVVMPTATHQHFIGARVMEMVPGDLGRVQANYQFNGTLGFEAAGREVPLRERKVKALQYFPEFAHNPGGLQETLHIGALPRGTYHLSTDFYTLGQWFVTVKGKQYCGKGFRNRSYSSYPFHPVVIQ